MQYIFVIPLIVSAYLVLRGRRDVAFLYVYLPCTFLIPYYYGFRVPHLAVLSAGTAALLPIGISAILRPEPGFKLRRLDILVVLYVMSFALSEFLKDRDERVAAFAVVSYPLLEIFMGYCVGRGVLEPRLRIPTASRMVFCMMLLTPFLLYEFRFGRNPWLILAGSLGLPDAGWSVQLRSGQARIAGCFGHAILAGTMFLVAIALNEPLRALYRSNKTMLGARMLALQRFHVPEILLVLFILMTRSRGPIGCMVVSLMILQVPKFKNMRAAAITIAVIIAIGGVGVYNYLDHYTQDASGSQGEEQSSAVYRRRMLDIYKPVIERGGLLGYGIYNRPTPNLGSTDNHYLLLQMIQGQAGFYLFVFLGLESGVTLISYAASFRSRESLYFVFALFGAIAGIFLSILTVYMGEQLGQVLFLLMGWGQSLRDGEVEGPERKYLFRRVLT